MNTNQINCFLTVAECENISAAAQKLYVSQPVISRIIAALEKELELRLFEKAGRNIRLTPFGREFYELLSRQKIEHRQLVSRYQQQTSGSPIEMRIAYSFGWYITPMLSEFIHSFEKSHPNITLSFRAMSFVEMNAGLEEGTVDALLTLENSAPSKSLFSLTPLCPLENCILYSRKHPVCQNHADPTLDDFAGSTLYYLPSTDVTDMDGILRKILAPYHLDLALKMERSWQTCIANVLLGRGIVLTDEWAFEKTQSQFLSAALPEAQALVLVTAKNNPYVEDLRKHLLLAIRGVE